MAHCVGEGFPDGAVGGPGRGGRHLAAGRGCLAGHLLSGGTRPAHEVVYRRPGRRGCAGRVVIEQADHPAGLRLRGFGGLGDGREGFRGRSLVGAAETLARGGLDHDDAEVVRHDVVEFPGDPRALVAHGLGGEPLSLVGQFGVAGFQLRDHLPPGPHDPPGEPRPGSDHDEARVQVAACASSAAASQVVAASPGISSAMAPAL